MGEKLGQHFLKDGSVVKKITDAARLTKDSFVLEVGPGKGILTEALAKRAKKVLAIETDATLVSALKKKFAHTPSVQIICEDILKINLPKLLSSYLPSLTHYKLVSNLPYYIASPTIRLFLETLYPPSEMILMIQKEVAQRITARPGSMTILAVSVHYYAQAEILFFVPHTAFDPEPQVDSAVIRITRDQRRVISDKERKHFFRIVRAGFSSKRKILCSNLANGLSLEKKLIIKKLHLLGLSEKSRAQELSVAQWEKLSTLLSSHDIP